MARRLVEGYQVVAVILVKEYQVALVVLVKEYQVVLVVLVKGYQAGYPPISRCTGMSAAT